MMDAGTDTSIVLIIDTSVRQRFHMASFFSHFYNEDEDEDDDEGKEKENEEEEKQKMMMIIISV